MKTWTMMYLLIWVAFLQILIIMFPVLGSFPTYDLHLVVGVAVIGLAYTVYSRVSKTNCPARIKRITKTTAYLGVFQAILGLILYLVLRFAMGVPFTGFINFIHVAVAIAMITQASSSATAFDMWEEKEFTLPTTTGAIATS